MKKMKWLLSGIGFIQIVLGLFYLFTPNWFLRTMGHSLPEPDIQYPLAMLAARFLGVGFALLVFSRNPSQARSWMQTLLGIQGIDLAAGLYFTLMGVVPLHLSGFPMFNAIWMILLLWRWLPQKQS